MKARVKKIADDEYLAIPRLLFSDSKKFQEDYSNRVVRSASILNSTFIGCNFERLIVKPGSICFGAGKIASEYIDCSFDHSKFVYVSGIARFVHCSFKNVIINEMFALTMEFIDCFFSGKFKNVVFDIKLQEKDRKILGRDTNQFEGNDFSECKLNDNVAFRGGIDFHKQKMPVDDNLLYVYNPDLIQEAKNKLLNLDDRPYQKKLLLSIKSFEMDFREGQRHFLFPLDKYTKNETEKAEIISLFQASNIAHYQRL